tara:strand:+ start:365 stop:553 length:189 start_codon:yes stop_codon:yes gene_type:complete
VNRSELKVIVQNLKSLVSELESEVYSDTSAYVHPWYKHTDKIEEPQQNLPIDDYDEVWTDDE